MMLPYLLRLACLCFASFFAAQILIGTLLFGLAHWSATISKSFRAGVAARILLFARIAPLCAGVFVVLALCVPSYVWLEPIATNERVGLLFCAAGALGAWLSVQALSRACSAATRSIRFARACSTAGEVMTLSVPAATATVVSEQNVTLAMAGLFRPQLLVSRKVLDDLSTEQLDVALRHELAHRRSMDNFKQLLVMLSPEFAPFQRAFRRLEAEWRRVSEWAADDAASAGDPSKAVALAEALLRVARIAATEQLSPLCSTFVPGRADLAERVERLLNPQPPILSGPLPWKRIAAPFSVVFTLALILIVSRPATLHFVHELLERMTH